MLEADDDINDPEQRLLRFLQAQGIDTSRIAKGTLDEFLSSSNSRRPLFLQVGSQSIRVPTLFRRKSVAEGGDEQDEGSAVLKIPPADVPEDRLFSLLQRQRPPLIPFL